MRRKTKRIVRRVKVSRMKRNVGGMGFIGFRRRARAPEPKPEPTPEPTPESTPESASKPAESASKPALKPWVSSVHSNDMQFHIGYHSPGIQNIQDLEADINQVEISDIITVDNPVEKIRNWIQTLARLKLGGLEEKKYSDIDVRIYNQYIILYKKLIIEIRNIRSAIREMKSAISKMESEIREMKSAISKMERAKKPDKEINTYYRLLQHKEKEINTYYRLLQHKEEELDNAEKKLLNLVNLTSKIGRAHV